VIELFPDSATVVAGELVLGGVPASRLADELGTPLVVFCEETIRARAREIGEAVPGSVVVFGSKAFPNVSILRLLAEEGIGADVASPGELAVAREAGIGGERLVVHGNNKPDELLQEAAREDALVVLDGADEAERAATAGVRRVLVRVTLGVEADTHEAIRTGHHGSKFGLPPEQAKELVRDALDRGLETVGLHAHVGSQLTGSAPYAQTVALLAEFAAALRDELGWAPRVVDVGGGFPVRHVVDDFAEPLGALAAETLRGLRSAWEHHGLEQPVVFFEPGRALVGQAGVTLYRVGAVKRLAGVTWVAVDGGMSDNPRPALYDARYTALSALRADEQAAETVSVAGLHCESGDVLIDDVRLPSPRRGDLLAVPATGAYTLAMSSNYNAVPRPAAALVANGEARLVRRRETLRDLLALEAGAGTGDGTASPT
jgi:diaminopimelate decarboxylase